MKVSTKAALPQFQVILTQDLPQLTNGQVQLTTERSELLAAIRSRQDDL